MALEFTDYRHGIAVANGDLAAELFLRGWDSDVPVELAAIRRGDIVRDAVQAFLDAGAEVLTTCTDRANALAWEDCDGGVFEADADLSGVNEAAAKLFREAVSDYPGSKAMVLGAIGPSQRLFVLDELDEEAVRDAYREQAASLASGGVDGLLFRGFTELRSLEAAVRAARSVTDLPIIGGMRFDCGLERAETSLGATVAQACVALHEVGVSGIGCDAADDPDAAVELAKLVKASTTMPVYVELNPGRPELVEGAVHYPESPQEFGQRLPPLVKAGVSMIGGARGATTAHIAALVASRQRMK